MFRTESPMPALFKPENGRRLSLSLIAFWMASAPAFAETLPSLISFSTTEHVVTAFPKGGPKGERFSMEAGASVKGTGKTLIGGGFAGTCSGLPADYGVYAKDTARFLYHMGQNIALEFSCKYSLWKAQVTMKSTSSFTDGLLKIKATVDFKRSDGKEIGRGEEEGTFDLTNGKCIVLNYRRSEVTRETNGKAREEVETVTPNTACSRMR